MITRDTEVFGLKLHNGKYGFLIQGNYLIQPHEHSLSYKIVRPGKKKKIKWRSTVEPKRIVLKTVFIIALNYCYVKGIIKKK
jgi:hypothetical protein